jgi:ketosteroid isomerase-like protein
MGPKLTKFDDWEPLDRQDARTAMKAERDGFSQISDLDIQIKNLKADVFGALAISTFILDYTMKAGPEQIADKARGTFVFVKVGDSWKITHEHFSLFKANA